MSKSEARLPSLWAAVDSTSVPCWRNSIFPVQMRTSEHAGRLD